MINEIAMREGVIGVCFLLVVFWQNQHIKWLEHKICVLTTHIMDMRCKDEGVEREAIAQKLGVKDE